MITIIISMLCVLYFCPALYRGRNLAISPLRDK